MRFAILPAIRWQASDGTVAPLLASGVAPGTIGSTQLAAAAVGAAQLADGSVSAAKIADNSITNVDVAAGAAIDAAKLGTGVVSTAEFNFLDGVTSGVQSQLNGKLALTGGALTGALTAPALNFTAAQTRFLAVPAAAFRPSDSTVAYTSSTTGVLPTASGASTVNFTAPVFLPHGAVITGIELAGRDNDASLNLTVRLISSADTASSGTIVTTLVTAGAISAGQEVSSGVLSKTVANDTERLFLHAFWDASAGALIDLRKVTITYTVTQPLP